MGGSLQWTDVTALGLLHTEECKQEGEGLASDSEESENDKVLVSERRTGFFSTQIFIASSILSNATLDPGYNETLYTGCSWERPVPTKYRRDLLLSLSLFPSSFL